MSTITANTLTTAQDLLLKPKDGFRYDLIEGELHKMWPAGFLHGEITSSIHIHLGSFVLSNDLGILTAAETGFLLSSNPDTVLAPDIGFIAKANIPTQRPTSGYFPGAPDLAVEVVSPGNSTAEIDEKVELFLHFGTQLVWVVRPTRKLIEIHRLDGTVSLLRKNDILGGEDVVPGFSLPISPHIFP